MNRCILSAIADQIVLAEPIESEEVNALHNAIENNDIDEYFESVTKSTMETLDKLTETSASQIVIDFLNQNPESNNDYSDFMNSSYGQSLPIPIKQDTFGGIRSRWRVATGHATRGKFKASGVTNPYSTYSAPSSTSSTPTVPTYIPQNVAQAVVEKEPLSEEDQTRLDEIKSIIDSTNNNIRTTDDVVRDMFDRVQYFIESVITGNCSKTSKVFAVTGPSGVGKTEVSRAAVDEICGKGSFDYIIAGANNSKDIPSTNYKLIYRKGASGQSLGPAVKMLFDAHYHRVAIFDDSDAFLNVKEGSDGAMLLKAVFESGKSAAAVPMTILRNNKSDLGDYYIKDFYQWEKTMHREAESTKVAIHINMKKLLKEDILEVTCNNKKFTEKLHTQEVNRLLESIAPNGMDTLRESGALSIFDSNAEDNDSDIDMGTDIGIGSQDAALSDSEKYEQDAKNLFKYGTFIFESRALFLSNLNINELPKSISSRFNNVVNLSLTRKQFEVRIEQLRNSIGDPDWGEECLSVVRTRVPALIRSLFVMEKTRTPITDDLDPDIPPKQIYVTVDPGQYNIRFFKNMIEQYHSEIKFASERAIAGKIDIDPTDINALSNYIEKRFIIKTLLPQLAGQGSNS